MDGTLPASAYLQTGSSADAGSNPRSAWGRVVAVRLFTHASNTQWLDHLITSITLIKNASGLAPFPYLGVAAGITVKILEIIQVSVGSCTLSMVHHNRPCSPPTRIGTIFATLRPVWY